ncbi:hypothetical protein [Arthrobacter sp. UM1]|uniref:hypothetical protein n=1 Tax=Arthrobacter sp. UM1 TaxID=2766776 RepID=UPI001CF6699F|nr:hypothetical protein [Arthrobacter sp. UM1]MCB4209079.1 hypothetical protein [Arthrobacter sp. UM1]
MQAIMWILVAVAVAGLIMVLLRKGRGAAQEAMERSATPEFAAQASGRLDEQTHRQVYALIAQGRQQEAVEAYQNATRSTLFESITAVNALARHPQEHRGGF